MSTLQTERIKSYQSVNKIPPETFGLVTGEIGPVYYNNNGTILCSPRPFATNREATAWVRLQKDLQKFQPICL